MTTTPEGGHFIDRLAPGWLVVQFLGTGMLVVALVTAREDSLWIWGVYAFSVITWILFIVLHPWRPRGAAAVLAASALVPALVVGAADDSTAVILLCVMLGRFTSLTAPSGQLIAGVTAVCLLLTWISCTAADRPLSDVLGYPLLILVLTLLSLNRRQSQLRAEQAEQLLDQTRLVQQEQARAAALAERTRIAREMHDVLAHSLGALTVQLKVAEALIEKGDTQAALARVRRSNRLADEGLTEARNAVAALRGDVPSLPAALRDLVAEHRASHPGEVTLDITGEARRLEPAAAVSLIQATREALTNAAKHAAGERVEISLDFGDDAVHLRVANSTPRDTLPDADHVPGYGLTGMRERIALVGGTLAAAREDEGRAWVLSAEVPV
ncbi:MULTISPECIES: sensor histidine kinase [unclassified Streptomyces]|uniref:sensor histidine kinase n=1 Tax=unclassified Streptomyces TaxID=2593676 RepID=UPI000AC2D477|nr:MULTISPECIES: histidine kinase [unclassified Streptomyces]AZM62243.1 sensor histidine kinase [Streptomyces sp. WAC 01438]RSM96263.1 sensor histidine kinase [Streptomyces sp. WAC 01420]UUG66795.1 Ktm33 [Streptomyces sp.]